LYIFRTSKSRHDLLYLKFFPIFYDFLFEVETDLLTQN